VGLGLDGAVVNEDIRTTIVPDEEAKAFAVAELLYGAKVLKQDTRR
jgi:hypothetical protein